MVCEYFGICASCNLYDISYEKQIQKKENIAKEEFALDIPLQLHSSKLPHFRNRAEFRIFHQDNKISYAMHTYDKKILPIKSCPIVCSTIYKLMPLLIENIQKEEILENKLFAIEFLSSDNTNETLVSMIYHKKLSNEWELKARELQDTFNIFIIGRSRKQKNTLGKSFIQESLNIFNKKYILNYYEASFTQPNTSINEKMIEFAISNTKNIDGDLLELYCGCGNFTIPLSQNFNKVLATEISKKSIISAKENATTNNTKNISFVRLSSQELIQAFNKTRVFNRLRDVDLSSFNIKAVLIDPPRAGLDEDTIEFIKNFEFIIYISCNIQSLKRDSQILQNTHKIKNWAMFDQFAYTNHMEMGMMFVKDG